MNLPFRKQQNEPVSNTIIPEMNGPVEQPAVSGRARVLYWVRMAVLVLVALLILWLLFLGGRWVVHKVSHHSSKAPSGTVTIGQGSPNSTTTNTSGNNSSSGQSSNQNSSSQSQSNSGSTAKSNTLVNTGPGSAAAIFLITTATGVTVYQVALRRKAE